MKWRVLIYAHDLGKAKTDIYGEILNSEDLVEMLR